MPASAFAAPAAGSAPVITQAYANDWVLGLSGKFTAGIRVSATDPAGIKSIKAAAWPDKFAAMGHPITAGDLASDPALPVLHRTRTGETAGESQALGYDVKKMHLPNSQAGMVFDIAVLVTDNNGRTTFNPKAGTFSFKRADLLSAKTSKTTARKGSSLTVAGRLNRADWTADAWRGYAGRMVAVQFRKAGSSQWTTVRWVRSGSTGAVSATVRDNASGSWRLAYPGDAASGAAVSGATWVTVK